MKYIIYCRKSSEEETRQIQSLETQERILTEYAIKNSFNVVDIIKESRSAKTNNNRPLFTSMLHRIQKGEADCLFVIHVDRLSRNLIEAGEIIKLHEEGYLKEIRTPTNLYNSVTTMLYMGFDFLFASHFSRDLSEKVKAGIQTKLLKGEYPSYAPLGYVNKEAKIYPDLVRIKYIKTSFELYSTGEYSLKQLTNLLYKQGFRTRSYGKKIVRSVIHRMLTNPVYYGAIRIKGQLYKGIHEPIVSKITFDLVQDVLTGKNKSRQQKHDFLYRDFLKCGNCGCKLTAVIKKQKHNYYYCTNGKDICDEHKKYLTQNYVYKLLYGLFSNFQLKEPLASLSLQVYEDGLRKQNSDAWDSNAVMSKHIDEADRKLDRLLDTMITGRITDEVYDRKKKEIENEKTNLEIQLKNLKPQNVDFTLERVKEIKNKATGLSKLFECDDYLVRRDLLNSLLWNASIQNGEIASVQYKLPWKYLQNLNKTDDIEIWRRRWDLNPREPFSSAV